MRAFITTEKSCLQAQLTFPISFQNNLKKLNKKPPKGLSPSELSLKICSINKGKPTKMKYQN